MLVKKIQRVKGYINSLLFFLHYRPIRYNKQVDKKIIFLDIKKNYHCRYQYLFLKFFHLEGYTIYVPKRFRLFHHLNNDEDYVSLLLKERIVNFGKPKKKDIYINEQLISPDYFSGIKPNRRSGKSFHVPMTQHPLMYHAGYWNQPVQNLKRKRSIFMAGNFEPKRYSKIKEDGIFDLMSRLAVYEYLKKKELLYLVESKTELTNFLKSADDNKVILINRLIFDIPMPELRYLLSSFDFYFALPGVVMPFSHNVIEAMSVGTIPFIQEEYANMFKPALITDVNCITFKDNRDLLLKLNYIYSLSREKTGLLRNNVSTYYTSYLTPRSLVKALEKSGYDKIYLQAEHYSVDLLKKRLLKDENIKN